MDINSKMYGHEFLRQNLKEQIIKSYMQGDPQPYLSFEFTDGEPPNVSRMIRYHCLDTFENHNFMHVIICPHVSGDDIIAALRHLANSLEKNYQDYIDTYSKETEKLPVCLHEKIPLGTKEHHEQRR